MHGVAVSAVPTAFVRRYQEQAASMKRPARLAAKEQTKACKLWRSLPNTDVNRLAFEEVNEALSYNLIVCGC